MRRQQGQFRPLNAVLGHQIAENLGRRFELTRLEQLEGLFIARFHFPPIGMIFGGQFIEIDRSLNVDDLDGGNTAERKLIAKEACGWRR